MTDADLIYRTLSAELLDRLLDAQFDADFDESGLFKQVKVKGRAYWYYRRSVHDREPEQLKYAGPVDDPAITARVDRFRQLKDDYRARRKLVSTLVREARLPAPDRAVGNVLEALWKAGVFRLRACLVGTVAYQCYPVMLGRRLPLALLQTGDVDVAQFHSVSVAVADATHRDILDVLREVDSRFRPAPHIARTAAATRFIGTGGLRVEFLTPNLGSDDRTGKPVPLPSLRGVAAEPLRFLDYLIHEPVRAMVLHKGGVPVLAPQPARFAVHKLIVAQRRTAGDGKQAKDLQQAEHLAAALVDLGRGDELAEALEAAASRGQQWRRAIRASLKHMKTEGLERLPATARGE